MFDLTTLDYVYVGVILASTIWATVRGGVYETIATMSWVVAAISARFASPWLDKMLQSWFGLSDSTVGTLVASYFIIFFAILILAVFLNQKLRDRIQDSIMNVTDKTLGVIFGIIRGVVVMGIFYWGALWYYSDVPFLPDWLSQARTRPIMQIAAVKLDEWFFPGPENKLLARDMAGTHEAMEIYKNLINPAISGTPETTEPANVTQSDEVISVEPEPEPEPETGYKSSERAALENQLLQIETVAQAVEERIDAESGAADLITE
ncbi:MAG: CvpA family protein [Alphaproteobacteria bacterium]|nr:CvpA family protein [Alphaproteobacteria bacterium]